MLSSQVWMWYGTKDYCGDDAKFASGKGTLLKHILMKGVQRNSWDKY